MFLDSHCRGCSTIAGRFCGVLDGVIVLFTGCEQHCDRSNGKEFFHFINLSINPGLL
jgi:hypothetical protein